MSIPAAAAKTTEAGSEGGELSPADIQVVIDLVKSRIAVQLEGKAYLIESRLAPVALQHNLANLSELMGKIRTGNRVIVDDVLDAMTTNETSFFRDQHPFNVMAEKIIPEVIHRTGGTGPLTIWNGASSSGQEPLSLAMMIHDKFPGLARPGRTRIIATDYSAAMVRRTKDGIYSRFEINRGLPAKYAVDYFKQEGRTWVAKKEVTDLIEVRQMNLIDKWTMLPQCDLVLMRNVLIYFSTEVKQDILRRIRTDVLKPTGALLLGSSESTIGIDPAYESVREHGSTIFVPKGAK